MPPRHDRDSTNENALPQDDAQMGHVKHFMSEMVGALQCIFGANAAPARQGLPLERLRALRGKEFRGVRGGDPKRAEYWLKGAILILGQVVCSDEDKLGCAVSLLTDKAHRWCMTIERGTALDRLT
ncbi:putative alpha,alpha-trehalose-phosphate synthase [UDP-forming] 9 [Gossypium australe]|uniref:Putative alpha,alpha-trehalose-phosphate synthase [UDP-forming] 9 n=1 Tax=Gossypium australe TaxID=47621 RepID=A0A5B6W901_9ROSI|nr:putative alpha,alpha-trehalose-phosphate synthase [UDP-forming] 9 [Gossypium australe]